MAGHHHIYVQEHINRILDGEIVHIICNFLKDKSGEKDSGLLSIYSDKVVFLGSISYSKYLYQEEYLIKDMLKAEFIINEIEKEIRKLFSKKIEKITNVKLVNDQQLIKEFIVKYDKEILVNFKSLIVENNENPNAYKLKRLDEFRESEIRSYEFDKEYGVGDLAELNQSKVLIDNAKKQIKKTEGININNISNKELLIQIKDVAELMDKGILTPEEFEEKKKILLLKIQ